MPEKMSLKEVIKVLRFDLDEWHYEEHIALSSKEWWLSDEQHEKFITNIRKKIAAYEMAITTLREVEQLRQNNIEQ